MLQFSEHFSVYHWLILAVGIGMTTLGYFVRLEQPMTLKLIAEIISESSLVDPKQSSAIKQAPGINSEYRPANPQRPRALKPTVEKISGAITGASEQPVKIKPLVAVATESSPKTPPAPIVRDSLSYDGIFSDELNGNGTITWPSQQFYRGDVRGGLPHGKGSLLFTDGRTFTGELNTGRLHGKGELHWPDGSFYQGEFINDVIAGEGDYTSAVGDRFQGEFADEKPHGRGTLNLISGNIYMGEVHYGVIEGTGVLAFVDGSVYEGEFAAGRIQGTGKRTWLNGNTYRGQFQNDNFHGYGVAHFSSGIIHEGSFANGKPNGEGKRKWPDGRVYRGYWEDGLREGSGTMTFTDGDRFEGEFRADMIHGLGRCYASDTVTPCTFFENERLD